MLRPSPRLLRWLRLAMACLALAVGGTPAHAGPIPDAPVAVRMVERSTAPASLTRAEQSVHATPLRTVHAGTAAPSEPSRRIAESHGPRPSRPLFILHRALLR